MNWVSYKSAEPTDTLMTSSIDRIAPTHRPDERVIGYHCWSNLLFVHWRVPAEEIEPLIPSRLTLDTFDGEAWIGLVPFHMSGVRPWWSPPILGISTFHETNVRTYVHLDGSDPGVWFLSLDAASSLAVRLARWRWHLPYYRSRMTVSRDGDNVHYSSQRLWPRTPNGPIADPRDIRLSIDAELGEPCGQPSADTSAYNAVPDTIEHFFVERYILFAHSQSGQLLRGRVHHGSYPVRAARLDRLEENLTTATGISTKLGEPHVLFSEGVDVEIFPLRPV